MRPPSKLNEAIKKWQQIARAKHKDKGIETGASPLCAKFYGSPNRPKSRCGNCPIKQHTGRARCAGTPYWKWRNYFVKQGIELPFKVCDEESKRRAQAMLDFLLDVRMARDSRRTRRRG